LTVPGKEMLRSCRLNHRKQFIELLSWYN